MSDVPEAADKFTEAVAEPPPEPQGVMLSPAVAAYVLQVVNSIQLPAAVANFEEQAALIVLAKRELGG